MSHENQGDLTSKEVMSELHCANRKFWDLCNSGELEAYYVGRHIRVTRRSVEEYKQRNKYTPRAELTGVVATMVRARKAAAS